MGGEGQGVQAQPKRPISGRDRIHEGIRWVNAYPGTR